MQGAIHFIVGFAISVVTAGVIGLCAHLDWLAFMWGWGILS